MHRILCSDDLKQFLLLLLLGKFLHPFGSSTRNNHKLITFLFRLHPMMKISLCSSLLSHSGSHTRWWRSSLFTVLNHQPVVSFRNKIPGSGRSNHPSGNLWFYNLFFSCFHYLSVYSHISGFFRYNRLEKICSSNPFIRIVAFRLYISTKTIQHSINGKYRLAERKVSRFKTTTSPTIILIESSRKKATVFPSQCSCKISRCWFLVETVSIIFIRRHFLPIRIMYSSTSGHHIPVPTGTLLFFISGITTLGKSTFIKYFQRSMTLVSAEPVGFIIYLSTPEVSSRTTHHCQPITLSVNSCRAEIKLIKAIRIQFGSILILFRLIEIIVVRS